MIFAAGFGTRLYPLTCDRTKPAIPFLGRPLIEYAVCWLRDHGIRDLAINLHHWPESIRGALGDGSRLGVCIRYSFEEEILGTAGALDKLRDFFEGDEFVAVNGKIVTEIDLGRAVAFHRQHAALATLVLAPNSALENFTVVRMGEEHRILGFEPLSEESRASSTAAPLLFTGIQILHPRVFEHIPHDRFSHITTDVYLPAIAKGEPILGFIASEEWNEFSTLARYLEISLRLLARKGMTMLAGSGCELNPAASIDHSVLWNRVRVEAGARVRRAIIGDDVVIPAGTVIEACAVVKANRVVKFERGEVMGENLVVSLT